LRDGANSKEVSSALSLCKDSNFGKENTSFICTLVENGDRQWRLILHQGYVSLRFFLDKWKALTV